MSRASWILVALIVVSFAPMQTAHAEAPSTHVALEEICLPQFVNCLPPTDPCARLVPPGGHVGVVVRAWDGEEHARYARLRIEPSDKIVHTDSQGQARFALDSHKGLLRTVIQPVDGARAEEEAALEFALTWTAVRVELWPPAESPLHGDAANVTMRVTEAATGAPIAGARVSMTTHRGDSFDSPRTDADGQARISVPWRKSEGSARVDAVDVAACGLPLVDGAVSTYVTWRSTRGVPAPEPLALLLQPPASWVAGASANIGFTVSGGDGGYRVKWRMDRGEWQAPPITVPVGTHEVEALVTDASGAVAGPVRVTVRVDDTPPSVEAPTHSEGWSACRGLTWRVHDDASGFASDSVAVLVNGAPASAQVSSGAVTMSLSSSGTQHIELRARDLAGNLVTSSIQLRCDIEAPTVTPLASDAGWRTCREAMWRVEDAASGLGGVESLVDGARAGAPPVADGILRVPLTDGEHDVEVRAHDTVGNVASARARFLCDVTPPVLEVAVQGVSAPDGYVSLGRLNLTADDATSGLAELRARVARGDWQAVDAIQLNTTGVHMVDVEAVDLAGNKAWRDIVVRVDSTPPKIDASSTTLGRAGDTIRVEVEELDSGLRTLVLEGPDRLRLEGVASDDGAHIFTLPRDMPPMEQLMVRATDAAGNTQAVRIQVVRTVPLLEAGAHPELAPVAFQVQSVVVAPDPEGNEIHLSGLATGVIRGTASLVAPDGRVVPLGDLELSNATFRLAKAVHEPGTYEVRLMLETTEGQHVEMSVGNVTIDGQALGGNGQENAAVRPTNTEVPWPSVPLLLALAAAGALLRRNTAAPPQP